MDKKTKKRLDILRKKLEKTQQLLGFAKQQTDEPDEIQKLEAEIEQLRGEIDQLKAK